MSTVSQATRRAAAFFDLDKTVIATSSTTAFAKPLYERGLMGRSEALRAAYAHFLFMVQSADADQIDRIRRYLSSMVAGWDVDRVAEIVSETIERTITPHIYAEARELMAEHRAAGRDVVIVSSSTREIVERIGDLLGADYVLASDLKVEDGRYTGEIETYMYGEEKARAIRALASERGYDLSRSYAYSDSVTDVPMLDLVGFPFVVNPDAAMSKEASDQGWPVVYFYSPVSLEEKFERLPQHQKVSVGLGGALILGGVAALILRRALVRR